MCLAALEKTEDVITGTCKSKCKVVFCMHTAVLHLILTVAESEIDTVRPTPVTTEKLYQGMQQQRFI